MKIHKYMFLEFWRNEFWAAVWQKHPDPAAYASERTLAFKTQVREGGR